jgi:hypothetical protein
MRSCWRSDVPSSCCNSNKKREHLKVGNQRVVLDVLTEITLNIIVFWDVTPCSSVYFGLDFGLALSSTMKIKVRCSSETPV